MRNPILEKRIIPVTRPTENQKAVMAKIVAAATPQLAAADISEDPNLVAARDMLEKMGLISLDDEGAHITDQGDQVMIDQNLVSPGGGLTDDGQKAAYGDDAEGAAPDTGDEFDLGMDFGDEDENGEFAFGDESEDEDETDDEFDIDIENGEVDIRDQDKLKEPKESFTLLTTLREDINRKRFEHLPQQFMEQLSPDEVQQLSAVVTRGTPIYKFGTLYKKAYNFFVKDMPYGTAKGRSGDPGEWLQAKISGEHIPDIDDERSAERDLN